ncbi:MAG: OmpA family protein [Bacteroidetes bacterium]|nr:OmpA family protein [Bacteroidota bacterium]HET6244739.1 OmpA family protein [Bacteroidia bacterium]
MKTHLIFIFLFQLFFFPLKAGEINVNRQTLILKTGGNKSTTVSFLQKEAPPLDESKLFFHSSTPNVLYNIKSNRDVKGIALLGSEKVNMSKLKHRLFNFCQDTFDITAQSNPPFISFQNKEFMANNIYYDLDKCEIRIEAAIELDKIALIMIDNQEIRVEMGAHTDSRASDEYNFCLSQKRAKAALDYLVCKGVNKEKISAIGYGKTKLINDCSQPNSCSELEHQANRRIEIKLIFEQVLPVKYTKNETILGSEEL